jgi:hypothetical protein
MGRDACMYAVYCSLFSIQEKEIKSSHSSLMHTQRGLMLSFGRKTKASMQEKENQAKHPPRLPGEY